MYTCPEAHRPSSVIERRQDIKFSPEILKKRIGPCIISRTPTLHSKCTRVHVQFPQTLDQNSSKALTKKQKFYFPHSANKNAWARSVPLKNWRREVWNRTFLNYGTVASVMRQEPVDGRYKIPNSTHRNREIQVHLLLFLSARLPRLAIACSSRTLFCARLSDTKQRVCLKIWAVDSLVTACCVVPRGPRVDHTVLGSKREPIHTVKIIYSWFRWKCPVTTGWLVSLFKGWVNCSSVVSLWIRGSMGFFFFVRKMHSNTNVTSPPVLSHAAISLSPERASISLLRSFQHQCYYAPTLNL